MIKLDRYNGVCNTSDNPSHRICVASKMEDKYLNVSSIMTKINE